MFVNTLHLSVLMLLEEESPLTSVLTFPGTPSRSYHCLSLHSICVHPALYFYFFIFFGCVKAPRCYYVHFFPLIFLKPAAVYTVSWSAEWKAVLHAAQTFFFLSATIHIYTMAKAHHQTLDLFCAQHFSRFFFFTFLRTLNIAFWLWSHHNSSQLYFDASVYCIPPAHCI